MDGWVVENERKWAPERPQVRNQDILHDCGSLTTKAWAASIFGMVGWFFLQ